MQLGLAVAGLCHARPRACPCTRCTPCRLSASSSDGASVRAAGLKAQRRQTTPMARRSPSAAKAVFTTCAATPGKQQGLGLGPAPGNAARTAIQAELLHRKILLPDAGDKVPMCIA